MIPTGSHPGNPSSAVHTYTAGGQTYDIAPTAYSGGRRGRVTRGDA